MRRFILGLLVGATLSSLRARAGQSLFELPAPSAFASYGIRALGLLSVAVALFHARRLFHGRQQNTVPLLGATLGFGLCGLLLPFQSSSSTLSLTALVVVPPLLARLLRGELGDPVHERRTLGLAPLGGLAVCAAGVTLALEGTARELRLLGGAASLDDTIFGTVFLALATFGALAFARTLAQVGNAADDRDWGRGRAVETLLALAAGLTLLSQRGIAGLSTHAGLREFMRRYGQDSFDNGMFGYDGILAAAVWITPAFALGAALGCTRRASELTAIATGAALACLLVPLRMATDGVDLEGAATSADLVREGILIAAAGAVATALLRGSAGTGPPRLAALVVAALAGAAPFALPPPRVVIAEPWKRLPTVPNVIFETPAGQMSISPGGADIDVVSLAGTYLTPDAREASADRNRLVESMELLSPPQRGLGADVLLIGQLTPGRALTLTDMGARRIDRTAAWHAVMPALEERLFAGRGHTLPPGEVLAPVEARERFASYDLVLAPAVKGEAPLVPRIPEVTEGPGGDGGPIVALWMDAGHGVHRRDLPGPLLLSSDGVEELGVAVVRGVPVEGGGRYQDRAFFDPGEPRDRAMAWRERTVRGPRRHELGLFLFTDALARANADEGPGRLARGLAMHYAVQRRSSMFETPEQKVEIDLEALDVLRSALETDRPPDSFAREVWNGLARILVGQRKIVLIYEHLEPLVERWGPWPELQLALAHADLESLDPAAALARVEDLPGGPDANGASTLEMIARARSALGDPAGAADALRRLGQIAPSSWQYRQLGIEATLAGEAEGRAILEELLADFPEDEELRALLEDGTPPPSAGAPVGGHLNHDH